MTSAIGIGAAISLSRQEAGAVLLPGWSHRKSFTATGSGSGLYPLRIWAVKPAIAGWKNATVLNTGTSGAHQDALFIPELDGGDGLWLTTGGQVGGAATERYINCYRPDSFDGAPLYQYSSVGDNGGAHQQINGIEYLGGGRLLIGANDGGAGGSWLYEYNISETGDPFAISPFVAATALGVTACEGCRFWNGSLWVYFGLSNHLFQERHPVTLALIKTHNLPDTVPPGAGLWQGLTIQGKEDGPGSKGIFSVSQHEQPEPLNDSIMVRQYWYDGTNFHYINHIKPPHHRAGQGMAWYSADDSFSFALRDVSSTSRLDLTLGNSGADWGYVSGSYGSLVPGTWEGEIVTEIRSTPTIIALSASGDLHGTSDVRMWVYGFGGVTIPRTGVGTYQGTDDGLNDYLANLGVDATFELDIDPDPQPLPTGIDQVLRAEPVYAEGDVGLEGRGRDDFQDVRIVDALGNIYAGDGQGFIEHSDDGLYAWIYAALPGPGTYFIYYGNPTATFVGDTSFIDTIEDFEGGTGNDVFTVISGSASSTQVTTDPLQGSSHLNANVPVGSALSAPNDTLLGDGKRTIGWMRRTAGSPTLWTYGWSGGNNVKRTAFEFRAEAVLFRNGAVWETQQLAFGQSPNPFLEWLRYMIDYDQTNNQATLTVWVARGMGEPVSAIMALEEVNRDERDLLIGSNLTGIQYHDRILRYDIPGPLVIGEFGSEVAQ